MLTGSAGTDPAGGPQRDSVVLVRLEIYRTESCIYKQRLRMSGFAHGTTLRMLGGNEFASSLHQTL
jgi:hypothetical protein